MPETGRATRKRGCNRDGATYRTESLVETYIHTTLHTVRGVTMRVAASNRLAKTMRTEGHDQDSNRDRPAGYAARGHSTVATREN